MAKVIVVGGGAAGMMAAIAAAQNHHAVLLLEKNEKLGKKLYITGKGRCNVTNSCDRDAFFRNVVSNPRFLYSAFDGYSNEALMQDLKEWGLPLKQERGNRVFPESDKSSDVIRTLQNRLEKLGVQILLRTEVARILTGKADGEEKPRCAGVLAGGRTIRADAVIVATGGLSYASTGSTGDGYRFAKEAGHQVTPLYPSLVALRCRESFCKELQGISLKNVRVVITEQEKGDVRKKKGNRPIYEGFGEMLFTHFGVSGPLMLSASSLLAQRMQEGDKKLVIDLKPALTEEQLDARLLRTLEENRGKSFKNAAASFLPAKLLDAVFRQSGVDREKRAGEIAKAERMAFIRGMKELTLTITGLCDYNEAIVTKGGVSVKEITPATMESRLVSGLYFAGEVLDLDALTGGFNLQIAWSTGYAAGNHIGMR